MNHLEAIRHVLRCYPNWACPAETAQAWALELAPIPAEAVYAAAKALCLESEYPPTLAAIHKRATILARPAGSLPKTVAEAWDEMQRNRKAALHNRSIGRYRNMATDKFDDDKPIVWTSDAIRRASEAINFDREWGDESMGTIRAQFERYYREECERKHEVEWAEAVRLHVSTTQQIGAATPNLLERR